MQSLPDRVYTLLIHEAGASPDKWARHDFEAHWDDTTEYRFMGSLGFGGKFWRVRSTEGERWYVNCYQENETPERLAIIERVNAKLRQINPYVTGKAGNATP